MAEISRLVATFSLNAMWQITAITALAFLCTKLFHSAPSRISHGVWIAALGACVLIPAATVVVQHRDATGRAAGVTPGAQADSAAEPSARAIPVSFHSLSRSVSFSPRILYALLWGYVVVLLFHVARLAWFGYRTRSARQLAYPRPLPPRLARTVERCARSFSLPSVSVLCTAELSGPATLGFGRPLLLLPETFFLDSFSEDDLVSAISHELAHVLRRDFLFNLLYEIASLPVGFHPCATLILSRIAHTRELACDEIAAQMLPTTERYATSLLHMAQSMLTRARSKYALGLFDANTLEERIMKILKNNGTPTKTRAMRWITVGLIGAASIGLPAFSLRLNNASSPEGPARFAGTWEAKYQGTTFFTVHLTLANGSLGGTCVVGERWAILEDGEFVPDGSELSTHKILEATASGKKLLVKIAGNKIGDDENSPEFVPLELTLTGRDQAEGRVVAGPNSDAPPPQTKPWNFQRVPQ
jgi:beta-lactamase regulating signal transducer with metallopeptidase domain